MSAEGENKRGAEELTGAVLVVGAGISGIQTALELADSGFKVYLLDRSPGIGGTMAMLDKTFPTNDCSMCILAPKLVTAGRHPNIQLLTNAELIGLSGEPGRFTAKILQHPRYVLLDKCTGCMECVKNCPVSVPDGYNQGISNRNAVYKLYPQAIPNAVAIDKNERRAPCRLACPAGVNAQGYVALIRQRKFKEAYKLVQERLPFVGVCGRVCHHPCEEKCNRQEVDEAVSIRTLKRFLDDWVVQAGEEIGWQISGEERPERVAVIGAGPAGLTCALDLRLKGYQVTVFEASDKPGGMMRWGIPAYRLPRTVLDREIQAILNTGIELKTDARINTTEELKGLLKDGFRAVFVGIGAHRSRTLNIPGMELKGVLHGIEFLRAVNESAEEEKHGARSKELDFSGKRVVVIGGGNVAVDCAMCARRLGAEDVTMVCLEKREEMPAHEWEINEALAEGIKIVNSRGPKAIRAADGKVSALEMMECVEVFDSQGRFNPKFNAECVSELPADVLILAIGQVVAADGFDGIERGPGGTFKVDPVTLAVAGLPGVFAGGDAVKGPASVIEAVNFGHEAAISIDRFIRGEDLAAGRPEEKPEPAKLTDAAAWRRGQIEKRRRAEEDRRRSEGGVWAEINRGFSEDQAVTEAERCLDCGICCECFQCVSACEAGAIDHRDKPREMAIAVGGVVLSGGFTEYKPQLDRDYLYGRHPNVITSLEFERILSATGPYQGHVLRPGDKRQPKKIAWVQCVGSRGQERYYCSSVCCMFATKEAVIAKEHCAGGLDCHIYYIDMRCFGKGFERYYERAKNEYGVVYRRCRPTRITPGEDGDLILTYEDEDGSLHDETYNLIVLSSALAPDKKTTELLHKLGVNTDSLGFVATDPEYPVATNRPGIYACGVLTEPKDIPETVTEATAAAGAVATMLAPARGSLITRKTPPPQRDVSAEEPRIGVFICNCGINIGGILKVPEIVEYARTLPDVVYAEENLFTCSQDTQEKITRIIEEYRLNRVVVASCTPRTHEPLFQETLVNAGLNPYLFTMANIRDQCSWVHMQEPEKGTEKAKELVRMAVANARLLKPLTPSTQPVTQKALVIGGGIAGMVAALAIARQGFEVFLIEKEPVLGGNLRRVQTLMEFFDGKIIQRPAAEIVNRLEREVRENKLINVRTDARITAVSGYLGNYTTTIQDTRNGTEEQIQHGVFIVAVGAQEYNPTTEYFYGVNPRVKTQTELEQELTQHPEKFKAINTVAMIGCVGSRNSEHPYCSRVCCTEAIKNALRLKKENPHCQVYIFYRDIRTYGFREGLYQKARKAGVVFIRFDPDDEEFQLRAEQTPEGAIQLRAYDAVLNRPVLLTPDLVVLSSGIVPNPGNEELAKLLKVPLNEDGFFLEAHAKLRPVDFNTAGIFMAGMCHSPRFISETVAQALAAAARATQIISKKEVTTQAVVARVNPRWCAGCGLCERICQYEAARLNPATGKSEVTAVLCQGCGACAVACPASAIELQGFESRQLLSMIEEGL